MSSQHIFNAQVLASDSGALSIKNKRAYLGKLYIAPHQSSFKSSANFQVPQFLHFVQEVRIAFYFSPAFIFLLDWIGNYGGIEGFAGWFGEGVCRWRAHDVFDYEGGCELVCECEAEHQGEFCDLFLCPANQLDFN